LLRVAVKMLVTQPSTDQLAARAKLAMWKACTSGG
jgi:hypothetical protein